MSTKDIFRQLDHEGLATYSGTPYGEFQEAVGTRKRRAVCQSLKCNPKDKAGIGPGVRKFTQKDECPDCGHYLVWEAYRG